MADKRTYELTVVRRVKVSEHMLRITLGGNTLESFPSNQESAYIKFVFPQGAGERPLMRSYTIRHQRETEIDIDFALHDHQGPASNWAVNAQPGDRILIGGPGPKKLINHQADWFLLAGDMTALPAISVNLAELPSTASGFAVIEVASESDIQDLVHPENLQLHWVINPTPTGALLLPKIQTLPWMKGQPAIWAACEFGSMRTLRKFFKQEKEISKNHFYISSYWKLGQSDEGHKIAKKRDNEQAAGMDK
ncbi:siderophore-interacting protein [uncultured Microbulbifer sp.]|uniref:siderophore-interacting protein n=1 Tax=uncultured Microbulbifer sp. TaxID=348147 RepID=UPI0026263884|nr:siderophore-interacting protein [uncultured Microbulbifer sp.]